MSVVNRPDRVAIRVSGADAAKLLHDVLTAPVAAEAGPARWWALLSPQGKILAEGLIGWAEDAFWLDVGADVADDFFKRMRLYKLRAKAEIEDLRQTHAVGWTAGTTEGVLHDDARAPDLGKRVIADKAHASSWVAGDMAETARVAAGIAEMGPDFSPDSTFPHDIGMDLLGGVDFNKGCYVGQEVVSRMQHRGTARRRPVIVSGLPDDAAKGAEVVCAGRTAGTIGTIAGGRAVGILRLDRISDPAACTIGGKPVTLALPDWATYHFGESETTEQADQAAGHH